MKTFYILHIIKINYINDITFELKIAICNIYALIHAPVIPQYWRCQNLWLRCYIKKLELLVHHCWIIYIYVQFMASFDVFCTNISRIEIMVNVIKLLFWLSLKCKQKQLFCFTKCFLKLKTPVQERNNLQKLRFKNFQFNVILS